MVGVIALSVVGRLLEAMVGVIASSVVGRLLEAMVGVIASSVVCRLLEQWFCWCDCLECGRSLLV